MEASIQDGQTKTQDGQTQDAVSGGDGRLQPGELYRETLNEVLTGLLHGLKLHSGRADLVTLGDIIEGSSINPLTLERYFSNTKAIMYEMLSGLQAIIHIVETECAGHKSAEVIQALLLSLRQYPLHLKILLMTDNRNFLEKHLKARKLRAFFLS